MLPPPLLIYGPAGPKAKAKGKAKAKSKAAATPPSTVQEQTAKTLDDIKAEISVLAKSSFQKTYLP